MSRAFRDGSIGSQLHANTVIDGIRLRLSEGVASDDADGSAKGKDVVDPPAEHQFIEL